MNAAVGRSFLGLVLLAACFAASEGACAGNAAAGFRVRVNFQPDFQPGPTPTPTDEEFCRLENFPGAANAVVTVVCRTGVVVEIAPPSGWRSGKPIHGGAYRFLPPVWSAGVMSGDSDFHTGLGTVTSWRLVSLKDRDYLEMTVRW